MENRNILLILLTIAFSLVVLRACELGQADDARHEAQREHEARVEEMPAPPPPPAPPPVVPEAPAPPHKVVGEDLYDGPDQAKVEQILVVDTWPSDDALRTLLYEQYAHLVEHAGFQYHDAPTDVTILIYNSREEAANQTDAWIARLRMVDRSEPQVDVRT